MSERESVESNEVQPGLRPANELYACSPHVAPVSSERDLPAEAAHRAPAAQAPDENTKPCVAATALYTRDVIECLTAGAAFGFAASVFYLVPKYLTEVGMGAAAVGAATSAFALATVAATPLLALWIDVFGRVKILRAACILMLLSTTAFLVGDGYGSLLVVRALQGCAFACFLTALTAHVIDLAPPERLAEALGATGASMLAMNALAPAVAEPLAASHGWGAAFATAAVSAGIACAIALRMRERGSGSFKPDVSGLLRLLADPRTRHYAIVTAAIGAAFGAMFTFLQPFAIALGIGSVRGFFVAYAAFALGSRIALARVADRIDRFRVAVFALHLYTLAVLAASGLRAGMLEPLGALLGVAHGLFFPTFNATVMLGAASADRGKLATVFTGAFYGGVTAAGLPFGLLAARAGYPAVFATAAAASFAAGGLLVFSRSLSGSEPPLAVKARRRCRA